MLIVSWVSACAPGDVDIYPICGPLRERVPPPPPLHRLVLVLVLVLARLLVRLLIDCKRTLELGFYFYLFYYCSIIYSSYDSDSVLDRA